METTKLPDGSTVWELGPRKIVILNKNIHRIPRYGFIVDGTSFLGNPNPVKKQTDLVGSIELFDKNFNSLIKDNEEAKNQYDKIYRYVTLYEVTFLVCNCSPKLCHAEIIARKLLEKYSYYYCTAKQELNRIK